MPRELFLLPPSILALKDVEEKNFGVAENSVLRDAVK